MWKPWQWAVGSNDHAVENARAAATECSRRRLERAEVALYLTSRSSPGSAAPGSARHPA